MTITGTLDEFYATRARLRELKATAAGLARLGLDDQAAPLFAEAAVLGRATFAFPFPCMTCGQDRPFELEIAGTATPAAQVCGECSARIDAGVLAEYGQLPEGFAP